MTSINALSSHKKTLMESYFKKNPSKLINPPEYYHKDYKNDLPNSMVLKEKITKTKNINLCKRIFLIALPFLSLNKSFGKIISLTTNSLRSFSCILDLKENFTNSKSSIYETSKSLFNSAIAITAFSSTILFNPLGMVVTTGHDIFIDASNALYSKTSRELIDNISHLANNIFYMGMLISGSLEAVVITFTAQVLFSLYKSIKEYKEGNNLEAIANLAMSTIRVNQLLPQIKALKLERKIKEEIKNIFVGEPHEKWNFPSDHLPVGVKVDNFNVVSWNVLNNEYMNWVYMDSQGLKHSMITKLDVKVNEEGLTLRDQNVIEKINLMIDKFPEKKGFIALQECSNPFLNSLEKNLPKDWEIVKASKVLKDHNVILFNKEYFKFNDKYSKFSFDDYTCSKGRQIMNISFEDKNGKNIRIFNSHVPGAPDFPGRYEYADYMKKNIAPNEISIALGDMNFERDEMLDAFKKAGLENFNVHSPYQTNIDPHSKKSKGIDHIYVSNNSKNQTLKPSDLLDDLYKTIDQLRDKSTNKTQ